jgi:hypothetical protein
MGHVCVKAKKGKYPPSRCSSNPPLFFSLIFFPAAAWSYLVDDFSKSTAEHRPSLGSRLLPWDFFLPAIFLALLFSSMELVSSLLVPAHARVELLQPRRPLPQASAL